MASPYVLPPDQKALRGGCATPNGTLAWYWDQAYVWIDPSEGWVALAAAPNRIEAGYAVPGGVIAHGDDAMGFWSYGDRKWAWWQDELAFQSLTMPVNGWMLGQIPGEEGNECALLHCREKGLQWETTVHAPDAPLAGWFKNAPSNAMGHGDLQGTLRIVGNEIWTYDISSGSSSPERRPVETQEVKPSRRRPPGQFKLNPHRPPQVMEDALFLHFQRRGSLRLDLRDGTFESLGVAPISKSAVLWKALEEGDSGVIAKIIDTIGALPPASWLDARAETPVRLIDARIEASGKVRSVLTEKGMLPEPKAPSAPAASDQEDSGETNEEATGLGIRQPAPETWGLQLGRHSAEIDLCRTLCTSQSRRTGLTNLSAEGELLVESLLEQVGSGALELLIKVLREAVPPETSRDELDYAYNEVGLRQLATACGPEAAKAVEDALSDKSVPVRVVACWASGALESTSAASKLGEINHGSLGNSALWPAGEDAVPRDLIIPHLQGPPSLQVAAVTTGARLNLPGITEHLLPLLQEPPLLDSGLVKVRKTVLDALRALPDVPEAAWEEVKRCVQHDPSKGVRAAAARALGTSSEQNAASTLTRGVGDLPEVSHAAASVLPQYTEHLSLSSFQDLVDRWLLQVIGTRQSQDSQGPSSDSSVPETLLEDVLYRGLLEENQTHPEDFSSADAISPEDLSASSEWFKMTSWGLTIRNAYNALFGKNGEGGSKRREVIEAVFEGLKEVALSDERTDVATLSCKIEEDDLPEKALAFYNRAPELGLRLAALAHHALGPPQDFEEASSHEASHQPLHRRLQSVSAGPPPRERLRRVLQKRLAEAEGAGGALGLYVLAAHGDKRAEARLVDRLTSGDFEEVPLIWTLLAETEPFCHRGAQIFEPAVDPYLGSSEVPLARRWAAFQKAFSWRELRAEEPSVRTSKWRTFLSDCVGAQELLPWDDRHAAALNLAHRNGQPRHLGQVWEERGMSVEEVPKDERYMYIRDMLWADEEDLWPTLWTHWPEEADVWGLRMLQARGEVEAIQRIEAAVQEEVVPQKEAHRAIEHIRKRDASL